MALMHASGVSLRLGGSTGDAAGFIQLGGEPSWPAVVMFNGLAIVFAMGDHFQQRRH